MSLNPTVEELDRGKNNCNLNLALKREIIYGV